MTHKNDKTQWHVDLKRTSLHVYATRKFVRIVKTNSLMAV